jgi:hypothetical protein
MTNPMKDLDDFTDEELEQALARVLAQARGEMLNDAEVQQFWLLHKEIQRRRAHRREVGRTDHSGSFGDALTAWGKSMSVMIP